MREGIKTEAESEKTEGSPEKGFREKLRRAILSVVVFSSAAVAAGCGEAQPVQEKPAATAEKKVENELWMLEKNRADAIAAGKDDKVIKAIEANALRFSRLAERRAPGGRTEEHSPERRGEHVFPFPEKEFSEDRELQDILRTIRSDWRNQIRLGFREYGAHGNRRYRARLPIGESALENIPDEGIRLVRAWIAEYHQYAKGHDVGGVLQRDMGYYLIDKFKEKGWLDEDVNLKIPRLVAQAEESMADTRTRQYANKIHRLTGKSNKEWLIASDEGGMFGNIPEFMGLVAEMDLLEKVIQGKNVPTRGSGAVISPRAIQIINTINKKIGGGGRGEKIRTIEKEKKAEIDEWVRKYLKRKNERRKPVNSRATRL